MDFIDIQYTVYVYKKLKQYLNRKNPTTWNHNIVNLSQKLFFFILKKSGENHCPVCTMGYICVTPVRPLKLLDLFSIGLSFPCSF